MTFPWWKSGLRCSGNGTPECGPTQDEIARRERNLCVWSLSRQNCTPVLCRWRNCISKNFAFKDNRCCPHISNRFQTSRLLRVLCGPLLFFFNWTLPISRKDIARDIEGGGFDPEERSRCKERAVKNISLRYHCLLREKKRKKLSSIEYHGRCG